MASQIIWIIVGIMKAINNIPKDKSRNSGVCTTPDPSIFLSHIIRDKTAKITNQKVFTIHQKIQLIFIASPLTKLNRFLQLQKRYVFHYIPYEEYLHSLV